MKKKRKPNLASNETIGHELTSVFHLVPTDFKKTAFCRHLLLSVTKRYYGPFKRGRRRVQQHMQRCNDSTV